MESELKEAIERWQVIYVEDEDANDEALPAATLGQVLALPSAEGVRTNVQQIINVDAPAAATAGQSSSVTGDISKEAGISNAAATMNASNGNGDTGGSLCG